MDFLRFPQAVCLAGVRRSFGAGLILLAFCCLFSCSKSKDVPSGPNNFQNGIPAVVRDNFNLFLFYTALSNTGYADSLVRPGPWTLLAPSNAAFSAAGYPSGVSVVRASDSMRRIMPYLIIPGQIKLDSLPLAFGQPLTNSTGGQVYVTHWINSRDTAVTVNGVRVSLLNQHASNGLVNVLDNILNTFSFPDMHKAAAGDGSLSFFNAALIRSGMADTLAAGGPWTVFAPNNAAFQAIGIPGTDSIFNMDPLRLKNLVKAHVTQGRNFVYDYILKADPTLNSYTETMQDGSTVQVSLIKDPNVPNRFTGIRLSGSWGKNLSLAKSNVLAGNGVLHSIGTMLTKNF